MTDVLPPLPEDAILGVVQGQTYSLTVLWTDGADPPVASSMDGRYAHMSISTKRGAVSTPLIDSYSNHITAGAESDSPEDSRLVTGAEADITQEPGDVTGQLVVRLPATATAALTKVSTPDKPFYYFDLFTISLTDPGDAVLLLGGIVVTTNSGTKTRTAPPA